MANCWKCDCLKAQISLAEKGLAHPDLLQVYKDNLAIHQHRAHPVDKYERYGRNLTTLDITLIGGKG